MSADNWYSESAETTLQRLARMRTAPPPQPTLGRGLLYPGQLHSMFGESDAGKSLFMGALVADAIATGQTVLWIDYEQGADRVLRRLVEFGASDRHLAEHLERVHFPRGAPPPDAVNAFRGVGLVVVDAFTGLHSALGGSSSSDTDIEATYATALRPFADLGAAVVVIDHVVKRREDQGRFAVGSQRKLGAVNVALRFDAVVPFRPGRGGRAKLTVSRDRDGAIRPLDFVLTPDMTWRLEERETTTDDGQDFRPTVLMERVSRYLEAQNEPATQRETTDHVKGRDEFIRQAILVLASEGFITITDGPGRSKLLASERPFRADSDGASQVRPSASGTQRSDSASVRPPSVGGDAGTDTLLRIIEEDECVPVRTHP